LQKKEEGTNPHKERKRAHFVDNRGIRGGGMVRWWGNESVKDREYKEGKWKLLQPMKEKEELSARKKRNHHRKEK